MSRKPVLATLTFALALVGMVALRPAETAEAAQPQFTGTVPITGTCQDPVIGTFTCFTGTFDISRFAVQNGVLVAVGTLTGTVTNAAGTVLGTVTRQIALPVDIAQATCQILDLELGPLDLDLLGLMVHLDRVNLEITAQSGPGNLLGNLLCGIAGLLDTNQPLSSIARLLNQLLGLFG
jgi:hypothetical protein